MRALSRSFLDGPNEQSTVYQIRSDQRDNGNGKQS